MTTAATSRRSKRNSATVTSNNATSTNTDNHNQSNNNVAIMDMASRKAAARRQQAAVTSSQSASAKTSKRTSAKTQKQQQKQEVQQKQQPMRSEHYVSPSRSKISIQYCYPSMKEVTELIEQIFYSNRYYDDHYEYRHVHLPKQLLQHLPRPYAHKLLKESEWRSIGIVMSAGWQHYMLHKPEPHVFLFRREKNYTERFGAMTADQYESLRKQGRITAPGDVSLNSSVEAKPNKSDTHVSQNTEDVPALVYSLVGGMVGVREDSEECQSGNNDEGEDEEKLDFDDEGEGEGDELDEEHDGKVDDKVVVNAKRSLQTDDTDAKVNSKRRRSGRHTGAEVEQVEVQELKNEEGENQKPELVVSRRLTRASRSRSNTVEEDIKYEDKQEEDSTQVKRRTRASSAREA